MRLSFPNSLLRRIPALAMMAMVLFLGSASAAFKHVDEGMKFPEVSGKDVITGDKVSTADFIDDGAEAVIVVFWATWSARSIELLGDLKVMAQEHEGRPLRIMAVNVDGQRISARTRSDIDETLARLELPFPSLLDPELAHFKAYGVVAVPSTAILDNSHILRSGPSGYSFLVRDAIVDSIAVLLGLNGEASTDVLSRGYQPQARSLRYFNMAVHLANKGLLERALVSAERAGEADSLFSPPHSLRGQILLDLKEAQQAATAFSKAAHLDSSAVVALAGWGLALLELDDVAAAESTLNRALDLDPTYTPTLLNLARCRLRQGEPQAAEAHLLAALDLNPRHIEVLLQLGSFYRQSGRQAEALTTFRTALEQLGY